MPRPRGERQDTDAQPLRRTSWWRRLLRAVLVLVALVGVATAAAAYYESRTSRLQARYLANLAGGVDYELVRGYGSIAQPPESGPYDVRLGYSRIPELTDSLVLRRFHVEAQARVSPRLAELTDRGIFPLYPEKTRTGLRIVGPGGDELYAASHPEHFYPDFSAVPPLVMSSLLFIENRELLDERRPTKNPAVEWDRLAMSGVWLGLRQLGVERNVPGASTLATQIEKFRHSPGGFTPTPREKLRQMASAALRAYLDGENTLESRRRIALDYLNSMPLSAIPNHGEVIGLGDGLWAWFGADFPEVNRLLRKVAAPVPSQPAPDSSNEDARAPEDATRSFGASRAADGANHDDGNDDGDLEAAARAYRAVLSLLLAVRRPSYYLAQAEGRQDLAELTDRHLRLMAQANVVPPELAASALRVQLDLRSRAPDREPGSFVGRKGANAIRTQLLSVLRLPRLYELDRYDLTVEATLHPPTQDSLTALLGRLRDPSFVRANGLDQFRLLDRGDPAGVIYSLLIYQRSPDGTLVRVQADNFEGPFDINESARIELGSTAKLRTLVTYLEVIEELYHAITAPDPGEPGARPQDYSDPLSRWAVGHLQARPDASLEQVLEAAMDRRYSASPAERFSTGGGVQTFSNFDRVHDGQVLSVREAFRHSVNLPFVRMMRDIERYYMVRVPGSTARILEDPTAPERQEYLERFADAEGRLFMGRFFQKYKGKSREETLDLLQQGRRLTPQRLAWAFRSVLPEAPPGELTRYLLEHSPDASFTERALQDFYDRADPSEVSLADRGYLARIHPLELWVAAYLLRNPEAGWDEVMQEGAERRQEVYRWLFNTRRRNAQDTRIRTMLQVEAFLEIHRTWRRLGFPFDNLVPSYGTAIGSSGDRPAALAELVGIILNDGVRSPVTRIRRLHFAEGTPYETLLVRDPQPGTRVLSSELAGAVRRALLDVVENGTARRARGAVPGLDGNPVPIGGKTGTGDNRFNVFGPGGRLMESRTVNRTSSFVFYVGDVLFGVISAYVPGPEAAEYRFTSALPAQIMRILGPQLTPLLALAEEEARAREVEAAEAPAVASQEEQTTRP